MRYDPERHHRRSSRLPEYDYAGNRTYFTTICTHTRAVLFGNVRNGGMALNELGWIVGENEIELGPFVVTPNHLHGIVVIVPNNPVGEHGSAPGSEGRPVDATRTTSRQEDPSLARLRRQPRSLGSFVAGFKQATSKHFNNFQGTTGVPLWQRNFYERIVRNDDELSRMSKYIENNPTQWSTDRENDDRAGEDTFESSLYWPT
jgi:putative transposase